MVVVGYDIDKRFIIFMDPSIDAPGIRVIDYENLAKIWHSKAARWDGRLAMYTRAKKDNKGYHSYVERFEPEINKRKHFYGCSILLFPVITKQTVYKLNITRNGLLAYLTDLHPPPIRILLSSGANWFA